MTRKQILRVPSSLPLDETAVLRELPLEESPASRSGDFNGAVRSYLSLLVLGSAMPPKGSGNISLLCGAIYINTRTLGLSLMYNINKTNTYIFCFTNVYFRTRKILRDSRCTTRKQTMGAQDHFLFAFPGLVLGRPGATTWWRVLLPPSLTSH